jgi:hypothetical protein
MRFKEAPGGEDVFFGYLLLFSCVMSLLFLDCVFQIPRRGEVLEFGCVTESDSARNFGAYGIFRSVAVRGDVFPR